MPFTTGLLFIIPLLILIYFLERIPPPAKEDVLERSVRLPMSGDDRRRFLKQFGTGIVIITLTYLFLTVIRDVRDNYMANIWVELGFGNNYAIFSKTETNTSIIILVLMGLLSLIRKNREAFQVIHGVIAAGFIIAGVSSWLFANGTVSGALWMQLVGLGLYMSYIPFNCIFFERLIATFGVVGNVGFLIYIADSFGYFGSVSVMLSKEFLHLELNWSAFYAKTAIIGAALGLIGIVFSYLFFERKYRKTLK
jgi:hypothetical protein